MPRILVLVAAIVVIPILLRLAARAIGRAAVERQPDRIHLTRRDAGVWKNAHDADTLGRALTWKGFQDSGTFAIDEMPNVHVQLLADSNRSMTANIYEHPMAGQWVELVTRYTDGSTAAFSTMRPTGLNPRPGHMTVNAPGLDPAALLERALAERPANGLKPVSATDAVRLFEEGYADYIAWRKTSGVSAAEVVKVASRKRAA